MNDKSENIMDVDADTPYPYGIPNPKHGWIPLGVATATRYHCPDDVDAVARQLGRPVAFMDVNGYVQEIIAAAIHPANGWLVRYFSDFGRLFSTWFIARKCLVRGEQAGIDGRLC